MKRPGTKIHSFLLAGVFWFLATSFSVKSATVNIYGKAPSYKNDTLVLYCISDPVSLLEVPLGKYPVDTSGIFNFKLTISETLPVYFSLGAITGFLFVEPGAHYQILLPPRQKKSEAAYLTPFFQPQRIHLGIINALPDDLNPLISGYDLNFDLFFDIYAKRLYAKRNADSILNRFISYSDSLFNRYADQSYFQAYISCRKAMLYTLKNSKAEFTGFLRYFPVDHIYYKNPAWIELFNQVYKNILKRIIVTNNDLKEALLKPEDYKNFKSVFSKTLPFTNDRLAELILIKGLYDGTYSQELPRENLLVLLHEISVESPYKAHTKIAKDVLWKITRLDPGQTPPPFVLKDQHGRSVRPGDFPGKYVYLNFAAFNCYACRIQFPLLKNLQDKYADNLQIITVSVDVSRETMLASLETMHYPWIFLYYSHQNQLLQRYDVKSYPTYILLDPRGKILKAPAPSPVEGFDDFFRKLIQ